MPGSGTPPASVLDALAKVGLFGEEEEPLVEAAHSLTLPVRTAAPLPSSGRRVRRASSSRGPGRAPPNRFPARGHFRRKGMREFFRRTGARSASDGQSRPSLVTCRTASRPTLGRSRMAFTSSTRCCTRSSVSGFKSRTFASEPRVPTLLLGSEAQVWHRDDPPCRLRGNEIGDPPFSTIGGPISTCARWPRRASRRTAPALRLVPVKTQ